MDLALKTDTFGADDQTWLANAEGTDGAVGITLQANLFTEGTHYPEGFLKSGIALGKVTSTGLYGPYGGNASEVQTITVDATGGTFTITFNGETTTAIAEAATAATVQAAMEVLSSIDPGDVTVTGDAGGPFTFTFAGQYLGENVPVMTTNAGSLTGGAGTAVVATTTAGGSAVSDGRETFAGILFTPVKLPTTVAADTEPGGAMLDSHCTVIASKIIGYDAACVAAAPSIKFR